MEKDSGKVLLIAAVFAFLDTYVVQGTFYIGLAWILYLACK